jgi:hypothetical protein
MVAGGYYERESAGVTYDAVHITDGSQDNFATDTNADVVVSYPAIEEGEHLITYLAFSYSAQVTGGRIRVQFDGKTVFDLDIVETGDRCGCALRLLGPGLWAS